MRFPSARPPRYTLAALAACCLPLAAVAQTNSAPPPASSPGAKVSGAPAPPPVSPEMQKALAQLQVALNLHKQGKTVPAIAAYQEFFRLSANVKLPDEIMLPAYKNLYVLYRERQDVKGMELAFEHMAKLMPHDADTQIRYALLCLDRRRFDEAEKSAARTLTLKPSTEIAAQAHFALGSVAYTRKQWAAAEKEYTASLKLIPANPQVLNNLLHAQNEQHKTVSAIKTAEKLVKLVPNAVPAWMMLAMLRRENKDLPGAIVAYNGALKTEPKNKIALHDRALLALQLMRVDEAISAYAAYLQVVPNDAEGHFQLGLLYAGLKNYTGARKHFGVAVSLRPKDAPALFQWALSEREAGFNAPDKNQRASLLAQAVVHFKQAIALEPKNVDIQTQLAALYERDNRFEDAAAMFRQRLQQNPDDPEAYRYLTSALIGMRRMDDALAEWRKYRSRKPNDPLSYNEVAALMEGQNKWQEARDERLEQIKHAPKDGFAKLSLARAYRQLKQPENAASEYRLVLDLDVSAKDASEKERAYVAAARRNWRLKAWKGLSELAADTGKYEEAIAYLRNVEEDEIRDAKQDQKLPGAQTYLDIADLYERAKQIEPARRELKALTDARPDDAKAFAALADFEERQGQTDAAATALRRAEERDADPVTYGLQLAALYRKHNLPDKAIAEYAQLADKHPKDARILSPFAEYLGQAGNDARALALYDSLLKANPKDVRLLDKKAVALTRLKRYADSIGVREKIVDAQPNDYQAYANISYLYTLENKPAAYRQWLEPRVAKDPANLAAMSALIDAYTQQKLEEEGWKFLRSVAQKHKSDPEVQEAFVTALSQHNRLEEAISLRREMAQSRPNDLDAHIKLADLLTGSGNAGESNKVFLAMTESGTVPLATRLQARRVLAQRLEQQAKIEDAIVQYKAIVKAEPQDLTSTFALGRLLIQAGHDQDALAYYADLDKDTKTPALLRAYYKMQMGSVYEKQGRKDDALQQYREAQRVNPQNTEAGPAIQRLTANAPDKGQPAGQSTDDKKPAKSVGNTPNPTGK